MGTGSLPGVETAGAWGWSSTPHLVSKVLEKSRAIPLLTLRACVAYKKGENLPNAEVLLCCHAFRSKTDIRAFYNHINTPRFQYETPHLGPETWDAWRKFVPLITMAYIWPPSVSSSYKRLSNCQHSVEYYKRSDISAVQTGKTRLCSEHSPLRPRTDTMHYYSDTQSETR